MSVRDLSDLWKLYADEPVPERLAETVRRLPVKPRSGGAGGKPAPGLSGIGAS
jgi:hypothetical protein